MSAAIGDSARVVGSRTVVLHVFALCAFAIAQPLYDLLGRDAEFFVARRSEPIDLLIFVLFLSFLIPGAVGLAILAIGRLGELPRRASYCLGITLLSACIALPMLDRGLALPGYASALLALVLGAGFACALKRVAVLGSFLSLLSGATLVFPALFLFMSPAASIVMPREVRLSDQIVDSHTPVVFLLFDCLPVTALMDSNRLVDESAYPNFAKIAGQSTWYRNATTVGVSTETAVPALLSGRYPRGKSLPIVSHHPENLFTWLGSSRPIFARESTSRLCPDLLCEFEKQALEARLRTLRADAWIVYQHLLLPDDLSTDLPQIGTDWHDFGVGAQAPDPEALAEQTHQIRTQKGRRAEVLGPGAAQRIERISSWLRSLPEQSPRSLFYLHVYFPHGPFRYLPSGRAYVPIRSSLMHGFRLHDAPNLPLRRRLGERKLDWVRKWTTNKDLVALGAKRMLLQVGYADKLAGNIMRQLEENDLWDRALVVATSDHGESYGPDAPIRSRSDANTAHVPLFIKLPGQKEGRVDDRNAEIIDVIPTIADALGVEAPWPMDGRSLLAEDAGRPTKRMYGAGTEWTERQWPDAGLEDALAGLAMLVGSDRRPKALLRRGPRPDLLGLRTADLGLRPVRAKLKQRELVNNFDPTKNVVPAYLTGVITEPNLSTDPVVLAIAVNGSVRATTRSLADPFGHVAFAVLVPEDAYRASDNRVEVFEAPALAPAH